MGRGRLEAFSDGVIAILITIMVLDLKAPEGTSPADLRPLLPALLSYVLSFVYLGIYWNNHHHLLQATQRINGAILWANLHLLFWLSLIPFATGWMGEHHFAATPTALYGGVLLLAAVAYTILERAIIAEQGRDSLLAVAVGSDLKGKLSLLAYAVAIPAAFLDPRLSDGLYVLVALWWLIPDRRIERRLAERKHGTGSSAPGAG
ncbi:MAG: TMEM175 family protein [Magnetospirillum sp.]|nr:TMEM175 family protein [Magnetospirillum sp.]